MKLRCLVQILLVLLGISSSSSLASPAQGQSEDVNSCPIIDEFQSSYELVWNLDNLKTNFPKRKSLFQKFDLQNLPKVTAQEILVEIHKNEKINLNGLQSTPTLLFAYFRDQRDLYFELSIRGIIPSFNLRNALQMSEQLLNHPFYKSYVKNNPQLLFNDLIVNTTLSNQYKINVDPSYDLNSTILLNQKFGIRLLYFEEKPFQYKLDWEHHSLSHLDQYSIVQFLIASAELHRLQSIEKSEDIQKLSIQMAVPSIQWNPRVNLNILKTSLGYYSVALNTIANSKWPEANKKNFIQKLRYRRALLAGWALVNLQKENKVLTEEEIYISKIIFIDLREAFYSEPIDSVKIPDGVKFRMVMAVMVFSRPKWDTDLKGDLLRKRESWKFVQQVLNHLINNPFLSEKDKKFLKGNLSLVQSNAKKLDERLEILSKPTDPFVKVLVKKESGEIDFNSAKNDYYNFLRSLTEKDLENAAKVIRGDSQAGKNCVRLATAFIEYLYTGNYPKKASEADINIAEHFIVYSKSKGYFTRDTGICIKSELTDPIYSPISGTWTCAAKISSFRKINSNVPQVLDYSLLENGLIDLTQKNVNFSDNLIDMNSVNISKLTDALKCEAAQNPSQVSFGLIGLRRETSTGHGLAYFAKPDVVYFVDPQSIRGSEGSAVITDFTNRYGMPAHPYLPRVYYKSFGPI